MSLKLILASSSPYRRELLERLRIPFHVNVPDVDERPLPDEAPGTLVVRLAVAKANAIAACTPDALVIGSDQVAVIDGTIVGKPGHRERAIEQLRRAAGARVDFLTGLCVINARTKRLQTDLVPYSAWFRPLSDDQIHAYVDRERPLNCAGAFKSEGLGGALVERYSGDDPTALVGLPLIRLVTMLRNEGLDVLTGVGTGGNDG